MRKDSSVRGGFRGQNASGRDPLALQSLSPGLRISVRSRFLSWPVAILLLFLVVAASTGVGVLTLLKWAAVAGGVLFGLLLLWFVVDSVRSGPGPVEWPDAKVG